MIIPLLPLLSPLSHYIPIQPQKWSQCFYLLPHFLYPYHNIPLLSDCFSFLYNFYSSVLLISIFILLSTILIISQFIPVFIPIFIPILSLPSSFSLDSPYPQANLPAIRRRQRRQPRHGPDAQPLRRGRRRSRGWADDLLAELQPAVCGHGEWELRRGS